MKKLILCLCLLIPAIGFAQSYAISWYNVAGGGGVSSGTNGASVYSISGTIGQHDAGGPMTGGAFSLTGGFWSLISVAQTPGAPALYITHSGASVTIFWQDVPGWSLQQNSTLTAAANWSASSGVATANGTNTLTLSSPVGNLFFRLNNPK
ncbi:MAG TPA: hypothetical protein VMR33_16620 [Candidatus Baltobacteraceae bacterium]|jgi:hypothetical protein|nr:hypothetical protein [Candidatus Baltobacteraceae bacterium]